MFKKFTYISSLLIAIFAPLQVAALSCAAPPDPVDVFNTARLAPDQAVVAYGTFSGDDHDLPPTLDSRTSTYSFAGVEFRNGQAIPVEHRNVTVTNSCIQSIWCGDQMAFIPSEKYLVWFGRNQTTGRLSLHSGPCDPSMAFRRQNPDLQKIAQCLAGGNCGAADLGF